MPDQVGDVLGNTSPLHGPRRRGRSRRPDVGGPCAWTQCTLPRWRAGGMGGAGDGCRHWWLRSRPARRTLVGTLPGPVADADCVRSPALVVARQWPRWTVIKLVGVPGATNSRCVLSDHPGAYWPPAAVARCDVTVERSRPVWSLSSRQSRHEGEDTCAGRPYASVLRLHRELRYGPWCQVRGARVHVVARCRRRWTGLVDVLPPSRPQGAPRLARVPRGHGQRAARARRVDVERTGPSVPLCDRRRRGTRPRRARRAPTTSRVRATARHGAGATVRRTRVLRPSRG